MTLSSINSSIFLLDSRSIPRRSRRSCARFFRRTRMHSRHSVRPSSFVQFIPKVWGATAVALAKLVKLTVPFNAAPSSRQTTCDARSPARAEEIEKTRIQERTAHTHGRITVPRPCLGLPRGGGMHAQAASTPTEPGATEGSSASVNWTQGKAIQRGKCFSQLICEAAEKNLTKESERKQSERIKR